MTWQCDVCEGSFNEGHVREIAFGNDSRRVQACAQCAEAESARRDLMMEIVGLRCRLALIQIGGTPDDDR